MKNLGILGLMTFVMASSLSFSSSSELCAGFLPENDLKIPIEAQILNGGGISEEEFNKSLDLIQEVYGPIIESKGGRLDISRQWSNNTVNASANRSGNTYRINMYGGLARHQAITVDGFTLVACHEIGHHLAGAPKINNWFSTWASNEGQSDYFAGLQCLRRLWPADENSEFVDTNEIDSFLREKCDEAWGTQDEINLCIRIGVAGMSVTSLFRSLREEDPLPHYSTPDPKRVTRTDDRHPATQCRLDTYFQGGLCTKRFDEDLSDTDVKRGTCVESEGYTLGTRPRCWYGEAH